MTGAELADRLVRALREPTAVRAVEELVREHQAAILAALRPADPGPGVKAWQPIGSAPTDRPILWRASPGARVSVIDAEHYGECYLAPGSLWCEIPAESAALAAAQEWANG